MATTVDQMTELAMKLRLSQRASEKLAQRATESGRDVDAVASELIEQAVMRPTIDELLAPVRADFAKTGMNEDEIMELGQRELDALRNEKASRPRASEQFTTQWCFFSGPLCRPNVHTPRPHEFKLFIPLCRLAASHDSVELPASN